MVTFNCYDILGIPLNSTSDEIKKSYRKLATQYHPDKVSALPPKLRDVAHEEMRRINTAKETLLDAEKRSKHDKDLVTPKTTQSTTFKSTCHQKRRKSPLHILLSSLFLKGICHSHRPTLYPHLSIMQRTDDDTKST